MTTQQQRERLDLPEESAVGAFRIDVVSTASLSFFLFSIEFAS